MRMLLVAFVTVTVASLAEVQPASAGAKPWCAQLYDRGGDGGRTCGYVSWQQCRATTGLTDGFCLPNPGYRTASIEPRGQNEPRRHKHR